MDPVSVDSAFPRLQVPCRQSLASLEIRVPLEVVELAKSGQVPQVREWFTQALDSQKPFRDAVWTKIAEELDRLGVEQDPDNREDIEQSFKTTISELVPNELSYEVLGIDHNVRTAYNGQDPKALSRVIEAVKDEGVVARFSRISVGVQDGHLFIEVLGTNNFPDFEKIWLERTVKGKPAHEGQVMGETVEGMGLLAIKSSYEFDCVRDPITKARVFFRQLKS